MYALRVIAASAATFFVYLGIAALFSDEGFIAMGVAAVVGIAVGLALVIRAQLLLLGAGLVGGGSAFLILALKVLSGIGD